MIKTFKGQADFRNEISDLVSINVFLQENYSDWPVHHCSRAQA